MAESSKSLRIEKFFINSEKELKLLQNESRNAFQVNTNQSQRSGVYVYNISVLDSHNQPFFYILHRVSLAPRAPDCTQSDQSAYVNGDLAAPFSLVERKIGCQSEKYDQILYLNVTSSGGTLLPMSNQHTILYTYFHEAVQIFTVSIVLALNEQEKTILYLSETYLVIRKKNLNWI